MGSTPISEFLGVVSALEEMAEVHDEAERYGQGAILSALADRLKLFTEAVEIAELLSSRPDRTEWAVTRVESWNQSRWRIRQEREQE